MISLIYSSFKSGSCTLFEILTNNDITSGIWINNYTNPYVKDNFVLKCHIDNIKLSGTINDFNTLCKTSIKIDVIFIIIRNPDQIYKSGYFQDFEKKEYDYYFNTKDYILQLNDTTELVEHYNSINWNKYVHMNQKLGLKNISEYTGIDLLNSDFDKQSGYSIYDNGKIKVCILDIKLFNDRSRMAVVLGKLGYDKQIIDGCYKASNGNIASTKWYSSIYDKFKNDDRVINKLSDDDKFIIDKYL